MVKSKVGGARYKTIDGKRVCVTGRKKRLVPGIKKTFFFDLDIIKWLKTKKNQTKTVNDAVRRAMETEESKE